MRRHVRLVAACLTAFLAGCNGFKEVGASGGSLNLSSLPSTGTTVLVSTKLNLFSTYQSMVQTPASANTISIYFKPHSVLERGNLLPTSPQPAALNSSQQMVFMLAATEHCNDLVLAEAAIPDARQSSRKFFTAQPMDSESPPMSLTIFQQAAATLGTSFWRRALTSDEIAITGQLFSEAATEGLSNRTMLLTLCTVQLASASSLVH